MASLELFSIIFGWWLIGIAGFIYWWRRDWRLTFNIVIASLFIGVLGPFAWLWGYLTTGINGSDH